MTCEVSWKCAEHQDRLLPCIREAEFFAKGIGNEGSKAFAVCVPHATVALRNWTLYTVIPLAEADGLSTTGSASD
jgi:hypothetical protein